ncbi:MAG: peroxiredoxin [Cellulosilyticaceae bacterium]
MSDTLLHEGMPAPDFLLPGSDGQDHSVSQYKGQRIILYFYPRDNTPGCTNQALGFKEFFDQFSSNNTVILGVSRDTLASHEKFIAKHDLPFILLSDRDETVCKLYDVLKEKKMCGKVGIGIERSTFVINEEGVLESIHRKVKVPGHVASLACNL